MNEGFIKIYRKFFEHWLWKENRKLSRAEAWWWLLANARYKQEPKQLIVKHHPLTLNRGELLYSQLNLANVWGWNKGTVNKFLKLLEKDGMLELISEKVTTRIKIINYDKYNPLPQETVLETDLQRLRKRFGNDLETVLETVLKRQNSDVQGVSDTTGNGTGNGLGNGLETDRKRDRKRSGNAEQPHKKKEKKEIKKDQQEYNFSTEKNSVEEAKKTLHYAIRQKFEAHYANLWKEDYYWTAADGKNCTSLIKKLKFRLKKQKKAQTDDNVLKSFDNLLKYLPDWHKEHLSMMNINSKFNEIVISMQKQIKDKNQDRTDEIKY